MITKEQLKNKLNIDSTDNSFDASINETLLLMKSYIKGYCNNSELNVDENEELDAVLLYLCVQELNPETSLRAGKASENNGISAGYLNDLPSDLKVILSSFKKLPKVRFLS